MKLFNKKNLLLAMMCCTTFLSNSIIAHEEIKSSSSESYQPYFTGGHLPFFVGELGEKWQFPSDHLPRGMSIGDTHIAFWNILNKNYLNHIESNTQGLRDSSILKDNIPAGNGVKLTLRELTCVQIILDMINNPTYPRSMIALEETHGDVINYLKKVLPDHWSLVTPSDHPYSQDLYLYNTQIFDFVAIRGVKYEATLPKSILTLTLTEISSGHTYRFVQSHVPGGPNSPEGCKKFAEEVMKQYNTKETTIIMGDMNASPNTIQDAFKKAAQQNGLERSPFNYVPIDHPSHMSTKLEASWIDNFFIYRPKGLPGKVQASHLPEEVHESLVPIIELFKEHKKLNEGLSN
ncbi:MAG: hypothetical protein H0T62_09695 [Parachlamydiaceae bacterium]|nr:hypothetical protein [Parachlamydiaceae bacterium]